MREKEREREREREKRERKRKIIGYLIINAWMEFNV